MINTEKEPTNQPDSGDDLLTTEEAIRIVRVSKAHFSKASRGKIKRVPPLPCVQIGRRNLYRRRALETWIRSLEVR